MLPPDLAMEFSPRTIHMGNSNVPLDVGRFPDRQQQPGMRAGRAGHDRDGGRASVLRRAVQDMAAARRALPGLRPQDLRQDTPSCAARWTRRGSSPTRRTGGSSTAWWTS